MGLDITAYRRLKKADNPELDEYGYPKNYDSQWLPGGGLTWSESVWPGKAYPIEANTVYEWEDAYSFRSGSYLGYGAWREALDKFKGNVAFQELIDFADNEGVLGPKVSKKLRDDFQKYYDDALVYSDSCGVFGFIDAYRNWQKAFEYAADGGAVVFG